MSKVYVFVFIIVWPLRRLTQRIALEPVEPLIEWVFFFESQVHQESKKIMEIMETKMVWINVDGNLHSIRETFTRQSNILLYWKIGRRKQRKIRSDSWNVLIIKV